MPFGLAGNEDRTSQLGGKDLYEIRGTIFNDRNRNGVFDGEPGLSGWAVLISKVRDDTDTVPMHDITSTGVDGSYCFPNLPKGVYVIKEILKLDWSVMTPYGVSRTINLTGGSGATDVATDANFGNARNSLPDIIVTVFDDMDKNGVKNGMEGPLSGWTVELTRSDGGIITGASGLPLGTKIDVMTLPGEYYSFNNMSPGVYIVREVLKPGWSATSPSGESQEINLTEESDAAVFFGNFNNLREEVHDYKFVLDSCEITNTRSRHEDTDYAALGVSVDNQIVDHHTKVAFMGDVNNGVHNIGINVGPTPVRVSDQTHVVIVFVITNAGGTDIDEVEEFTEEMGRGIDDQLLNKLEPQGYDIGGCGLEEFPPEILDLLLGKPGLSAVLKANCDGPVAGNWIFTNGAQLAEWTANGPHYVTTFYPGTDSPTGCGSNSEYSVTWHVEKVS